MNTTKSTGAIEIIKRGKNVVLPVTSSHAVLINGTSTGTIPGDTLAAKLEEIDDPAIFERFDFKVANAPIYVDFKHWKESDSFDAEQQRNHIFKKLRECSGKCAIIINILAEDDHPCHRTDNELTILEVPYLYNGQPLSLNTTAINQIRRCLNEFTD